MGKVVPWQSTILVLAAAPSARDGIATIFSMVLSAIAVAVVSKRDFPLLAIALEITAAPPIRPTARITMAIISSMMLNPSQRRLRVCASLAFSAIRLPHRARLWFYLPG